MQIVTLGPGSKTSPGSISLLDFSSRGTGMYRRTKQSNIYAS